MSGRDEIVDVGSFDSRLGLGLCVEGAIEQSVGSVVATVGDVPTRLGAFELGVRLISPILLVFGRDGGRLERPPTVREFGEGQCPAQAGPLAGVHVADRSLGREPLLVGGASTRDRLLLRQLLLDLADPSDRRDAVRTLHAAAPLPERIVARCPADDVASVESSIS